MAESGEVTWSERQTKSAPCGADCSLTESSSSCVSSLVATSSSYTTDNSSDSESVTRSAPGDWSSNSSTASCPSPASSDEKLFYCFPYQDEDDDDDDDAVPTLVDRYDDDFDVDDDDADEYGSNGDPDSKEESAVSSAKTSASASSSYSSQPKPRSPLQLARWRQWRRDHGLDLEGDGDDDGDEKVSEASSSDEGDSDLGGINAAENSKQYKARILKRLLAEFDVSRTMRYYRNLNAVTYQFNPNDFSLDCSAEAQRMRERLIHLTGSDTIRVNDKDYMEKLRAKVWQEYEAELKRKEVEREDNERQRMRRLVARGIISPEQLQEDSVLWREYKSRANLYDRKYKGKQRRSTQKKDADDKTARAKSAPHTRQVKHVGLCLPSSPEVRSATTEIHSGALTERPFIQQRPATAFASYGDRRRKFSEDDRARVSPTNPAGTPPPNPSPPGSTTVRNPDTAPGPLSRRRNSGSAISRQKYEPPIIQEMRREETVAGLYKLAEIACHNEAQSG